MKNHEYMNYPPDKDGCTSRGACSLPPAMGALQELLLYIIKKNAYYILKLDKLNLHNDKLVLDVINSISSLMIINEINENQLFSIIRNNYYALKYTQLTYYKIIGEKNPEFVINFDENTSLNIAIKIGEQLQKKEYNQEQHIRNNIQILLLLIKNICLNIVKLYDFNIYKKSIVSTVLETLNMLNSIKYDLNTIKKMIKDIAFRDLILNVVLERQLKLKFGEISKVTLSHSTRKGKAILVSGNSLVNLLEILDLTQNKDIDIYTHNGLVIAHCFDKFRQYKNLIGHYGNPSDDCIVDFATFPGAILLTKNSQNNTEFLYRGRIFSNDFNIPQGVIKIENNDYTPLINSAINSKGFTKDKSKPSSILGYNKEVLQQYLKNIKEKVNNSDIKNLFIIIGNTNSEKQKEYYKQFSQHLNDDEFIISFSEGKNAKNILNINLGNYYPLAIKILHKMLKNDIDNPKITYIFNTCNVNIISSIIALKENNAKRIYLSHCSPRLLNPAVFESFVNSYNLNLTTNPVEDLFTLRKENV